VLVDAGDLTFIHQGHRAIDELAIGVYGVTDSNIEPAAPVLMDLSLNDEEFGAALKPRHSFRSRQKRRWKS
jgi:hypothetical protein